MKAELFAPGVVSTGLSELNSNFFPGGKEVIFSVNVGPMKWALVVMWEEDGRWTEPEVAPFSGQHGGVDPFVSYDGTLYFQSRRDGCIGASDIYRAEFAGGEYADAECLPEPINSPGFEGDAMIDPDERYLIVSTRREDALGPGGADLYVSFLAVTE